MSATEQTQLRMSRRTWRRLVADLARRGAGERESGAFLLARPRRPQRIVAWVPFDELDPGALTGAIWIRGEAFAALWTLCDRRGLRVAADVHTHPGAGVAQSPVDRANPMVALRGHVAIILPHFATSRPRPADAGLHVYAGDRTWTSDFGTHAARRLRLTWL